MNDSLVLGFMLLVTCALYVVRGIMFTRLSMQMAADSVPSSKKKKVVYVGQLLLFLSLLLAGLWLHIALSIPLYIIGILVLIGSLIIPVNTRHIFKKIEKMANSINVDK